MEINALLQTLQAGLPGAEYNTLQKKLEDHIRYLIRHDFERLVQVLYTVDVDERKLKTLLQQHPGEDTAGIICELILQRQLEKQQSRRQFGETFPADDEERW